MGNEAGDRSMKYTQAPQLTEVEIDALLKEANTARICSLSPDGTIHAATVNYKCGNGRIYICTPKASRKARNLMRNKSVTVLIDVVGSTLSDFKGVMIQGKAAVKEATFPEMLSISEAWMPGDRVEACTKRLFRMTTWVTISIEPARTASWDYGKDEAFAAVFQEMEDMS
jgi:nitroimidazol reductase NimA-like FMN-containing flavoprotein (pyridoxamine 5'-phosphate oxidase superfamily)